MIFLSDFLRAEIVDHRQRRVGRVADLCVKMTEPFPIVTQVVMRGRPKHAFAWAEVKAFEDKELALKSVREDLQLNPAPQDDVWLARDILDKQIVDTDGRRVVRVNDLQLSSVSGQLLVVGVDVGGRGLLRRLGLESLGKRVVRLFRKDWSQKLIAWDVVDPIHSDVSAGKLRISHRKLARMHPADIADVVERLSLQQRDAVFASLDDETAADALEELSPEDQADILERLDPERAADILEEMKPDEAADLLSDLPEHQQEALLDMMEAREADEVEELLAYGEDTAGGLMTTEYVGLSADLTAAQAIDKLRELEPNAESVYYVYVVDEQENLQGVLSLRDLIIAKPDTPIRDIMITNVIRVSPGAATEDVADIMRKYNLLAVPVVDDDGHMEGIVTVDDALDTVLAAGGRRRARIFG